MSRLLPFVLTLILVLFSANTVMSNSTTEILWDKWGVPHIFAPNSVEVFKAFGWAQAHSHGNLILRLYGQARGRAAEYWGSNYIGSDQYVRMMDIPDRAKLWYQQQTPTMRSYLEAFATGINEYAQKYPQRLDAQLQAVLPVTGVDVLAHLQRAIYFHFLTNPQQVSSLQQTPLQGGSNAWAIAPAKSKTNHALLLANPHLPWGDFYLWYEAHLNAPNLNAYGATLVGIPVLGIAFNDYLGWTSTVNPINGATIYQLKLENDGYVLDGKVYPLQTKIETLKIRQPNGAILETKLAVKQSPHGMIIKENNEQAYAIKVVGLERPQSLEQYWQMAQAKNLEQFEAALKQVQIPMFNIIYADHKGNIMYLFNGTIPQHSQGDWDYWTKIVPGDSSANLYTEYHPYEDLPRLVNPSTGWLHNTNDPPWSSTYPPQIQSTQYPAYFAPVNLDDSGDVLRTQRSLKMLLESDKISPEEIIKMKFSSRLEMADRILDYLIPTAKLLANPLGVEAAAVLAKWDRQTQADSRGAVLFMLWALTLEPGGLFARPWNAQEYLTTPTGMANVNLALGVLEGVAAQIKLLYGSLDVSWGEVVRLRYGNQDLPASGGPGELGSFSVLDLRRAADEKFQVNFGDSYIAVIEFGEVITATALRVYGNATQPNSPHIGDQMPLYLRQEMRPVWRTREEINAHLDFKEVV